MTKFGFNVITSDVIEPSKRSWTFPDLETILKFIPVTSDHAMTGRKNRALQEPPVVPYKALGKFPKALYGTTGGTCRAQLFRPVIFFPRFVVSLFVASRLTPFRPSYRCKYNIPFPTRSIVYGPYFGALGLALLRPSKSCELCTFLTKRYISLLKHLYRRRNRLDKAIM